LIGFMMHRPALPGFLAILLGAALLMLGSSSDALAGGKGRAAGKAKVTKSNGVRTSRWTANGVRFEHRTHGSSKIGWERRATNRRGDVKISGKLWGSKIKGTGFAGKDGTRYEVVNVFGAKGDVLTVSTKASPNGTLRKSILNVRDRTDTKITEWNAGGTRMRHVRVSDPVTGKTIKTERSGQRRQ